MQTQTLHPEDRFFSSIMKEAS